MLANKDFLNRIGYLPSANQNTLPTRDDTDDIVAAMIDNSGAIGGHARIMVEVRNYNRTQPTKGLHARSPYPKN
jgi:hypothetical protein